MLALRILILIPVFNCSFSTCMGFSVLWFFKLNKLENYNESIHQLHVTLNCPFTYPHITLSFLNMNGGAILTKNEVTYGPLLFHLSLLWTSIILVGTFERLGIQVFIKPWLLNVVLQFSIFLLRCSGELLRLRCLGSMYIHFTIDFGLVIRQQNIFKTEKN